MIRLYADGKCVAVVPDENDYDPPAWQETHCRNCGALLMSGQVKCDYCCTSRCIKRE